MFDSEHGLIALFAFEFSFYPQTQKATGMGLYTINLKLTEV